MKFKHIKDCWNYLLEAESLEDLAKRVKELPIWSGKWNAENNDGYICLTNEYIQYDETQYDSEDTDIPWNYEFAENSIGRVDNNLIDLSII